MLSTPSWPHAVCANDALISFGQNQKNFMMRFSTARLVISSSTMKLDRQSTHTHQIAVLHHLWAWLEAHICFIIKIQATQFPPHTHALSTYIHSGGNVKAFCRLSPNKKISRERTKWMNDATEPHTDLIKFTGFLVSLKSANSHSPVVVVWWKLERRTRLSWNA